MPLLTFTKKGIYCAQADVYIDPWKPVNKALITHGHADHSRWGHKYYLATTSAAPVIKLRLGDINIQTIDYGETIIMNGVQISFHPAGHIIGSAQIRLEYKGEIWVASGDYKVQKDGVSEDFEPVQCQHFITETTFGLPVYKWKPQVEVMNEMNEWWHQNSTTGRVSLIQAYSLGKAQRVIQNLDHSIGKIFTHGAVENTNEVLRAQGIPLKDTVRVTGDMKSKDFEGGLVIAPGSAVGSSWSKKFKNLSVANASGWMTLRGTRRRSGVERGFVLSDHADWDGLNQAIKATGATHVYPTHGYTTIFKNWLEEQGYYAREVETEYEGEQLEQKKEERQ